MVYTCSIRGRPRFCFLDHSDLLPLNSSIVTRIIISSNLFCTLLAKLLHLPHSPSSHPPFQCDARAGLTAAAGPLGLDFRMTPSGDSLQLVSERPPLRGEWPLATHRPYILEVHEAKFGNWFSSDCEPIAAAQHRRRGEETATRSG